MNVEETLLDISLEVMKNKGYEITEKHDYDFLENTRNIEFKNGFLTIRAYRDKTDIESAILMEYSSEYFIYTLTDLEEEEMNQKKIIKEEIRHYESMSKEELKEECSEETLKQIFSLKKYI